MLIKLLISICRPLFTGGKNEKVGYGVIKAQLLNN